MGNRPYGADDLLRGLRSTGLRRASLMTGRGHPSAEALNAALKPAGARIDTVLGRSIGADDDRTEGPSLVSPNADERALALQAVGGAVALACKLGARHIVLELGRLKLERTRERQDEIWARLRIEGPSESLRSDVAAMAREVDRVIGPYLEPACRTLFEICRSEPGIRFSIVTPASVFGFPTFQSLPVLLAELREPNLGYWHDVSAAHVLERLELAPPNGWGGENAARCFGVSLHDVVGAEIHLPPGAGEVDFRAARDSVPAGAPGVLEVDGRFPADEVTLAVSYLNSKGF